MLPRKLMPGTYCDHAFLPIYGFPPYPTRSIHSLVMRIAISHTRLRPCHAVKFQDISTDVAFAQRVPTSSPSCRTCARTRIRIRCRRKNTPSATKVGPLEIVTTIVRRSILSVVV